MGNVYVRHTKLRTSAGGVKGRIEYISDPKRQEYILDFNSSLRNDWWEELGIENRAAAAGRKNCVEAREFVIGISKEFYDSFEKPAEEIQKIFEENFELPCAVAIHYKEKTDNLHCHIVYSDRKIREKPDIKHAERNLFFDENGKRVYKKKEILKENGEIKEGCKIVKKGERLTYKLFADTKEERVQSKNFTFEVKKLFADKLNKTVFDRKSPFIAQKKIYRGNPRENEIREGNELVRRYNAAVSQLLKKKAIMEEKAHEMKSIILKTPIEEKNDVLISFLSHFRELERDSSFDDLEPNASNFEPPQIDSESRDTVSIMPAFGKAEKGRRLGPDRPDRSIDRDR